MQCEWSVGSLPPSADLGHLVFPTSIEGEATIRLYLGTILVQVFKVSSVPGLNVGCHSALISLWQHCRRFI